MEDLIAPIFLIVFGGIFASVGYYIFNSNRKIEQNGIKTRAKIIDFVENRSRDSDGHVDVSHYPVVTFQDKGIDVTQQLNTSGNPKTINQIIEIFYLREGDDYKIVINSNFWKTIFPMIFFIIGIIVLSIGVILLKNKL